MKEEFVSYSQAVALKECGFDWECDHYYFRNNETLRWSYPADNMNEANDFYSAPRLWSALKWLRDEKGVFVGVTCDMTPTNSNPFGYEVKIPMCSDRNGVGYESYEAALSAGLDAALELIKQM